jgi:IS5 family transposase
VPAAAATTVVAHDYAAPGKPACAWDDPEARADLVNALVNDALSVLAAVEDLDLDEDQAALVGLLALVSGQDVEEGDEPGTWRIARRVAPDRVISTVDPDARHMHKSRSEHRDGYKAHIAIEPDTGIITGCALTPANAGDGPTGLALLEGEPAGLQVLADSAYGAGDIRAGLTQRGHGQAIKPLPLRNNRRLGPDQFNRDDFTIDHHARTATCPAGLTRPITASGSVTFGAACRGCELRSRCTASADGKTLTITTHDDELVAARAAWTNGDFAEDYRQHRPMVERSIAWLVANGHRRVRYRGLERNELGLTLRVAALNLRRLVNLGATHDGTTWTTT